MAEKAVQKAGAEWKVAQSRLPAKDRDEFNPGLLFCGFDEENRPTIYAIADGGLARPMWDIGYVTIGIASVAANRALEWRRIRQTSRLDQVLYACYEAKRHAAGYTGVSEEFKMSILVRSCEQPIPVDSDIIKKLEETFSRIGTLSKFDGGKGKAPDWKGLRDLVNRWFNGGHPKCVVDWMVSPSPNDSAQPSSQLRNAAPQTTSRLAPSRPSVRRADLARRQRGSSRT